VDAFVVRNQDNGTNHFVLSGVSTNNGLDAKLFLFAVPRGYALLDE
jgi:hypothetical protein